MLSVPTQNLNAKITGMRTLCEIRTTISTCANFAPPHFGNFWAYFDHFPKFISCILYLISNLGKSEVHSFKRCSIWSWNKEVMAVWRWLCKAERKCYSCTPFRYCWTHFWSNLWSLNYAYHIFFWSLGSQESIASNGARFGVETKKLWLFEDDCAKLNGNVAAAPHFATVGHIFGALYGAQIIHTISLFEA